MAWNDSLEICAVFPSNYMGTLSKKKSVGAVDWKSSGLIPVNPILALSRSHNNIPLCCLVKNPQVRALTP